MRPARVFHSAFCLLLLASRTGLAAAHPASAPAARAFEDTAQVVDVEVPVYVTGRDGQPVRGLKASDFEVYDEGEPQKLSGFEVLDLDLLEPRTADANSPPPARLEELDSSLRRHFLFLFDLSFASPSAILKARLAARDFGLRSLRPTDLAAVATYSLDRGPRLVLTFTPDRGQLAHAIDTLGLRE
nr:hypothetical protein [Acidobacteriota bacterium]